MGERRSDVDCLKAVSLVRIRYSKSERIDFAVVESLLRAMV